MKNYFNSLGSKVKNLYNGIRSIKKVGVAVLIIVLVLLLLTSCTGITPPTPQPDEHDDVTDSHKVTDIAPYYETQKEDYCVIAGGVIISNYKINIPNKKLTQDEVGDAIFLGPGIGAYFSDLVDYINNRNDLDIQAEYKFLTFLQIQRMIEDNIPPLVSFEGHAAPVIGYNKTTNEITIYSTLDGKEHTMYEFEYLNPNYNKSAIIINKSELSTYLDNLL